jgi:prophage regulatory protein
MAQRLLTYNELRDHGVNYTRRHLDTLERQGKFPKRVAIGEFRIGWVEAEIDAHTAARIKARSSRTGELGSTGQSKKKRGDDTPRLDDDAA